MLHNTKQEPRRHFSSTHKLMNALEKVLRVSSTVQPAVMPAEDEVIRLRLMTFPLEVFPRP